MALQRVRDHFFFFCSFCNIFQILVDFSIGVNDCFIGGVSLSHCHYFVQVIVDTFVVFLDVPCGVLKALMDLFQQLYCLLFIFFNVVIILITFESSFAVLKGYHFTLFAGFFFVEAVWCSVSCGVQLFFSLGLLAFFCDMPISLTVEAFNIFG